MIRCQVPEGGYVELLALRWDVRVFVKDANGGVVEDWLISTQVNPGDGIWLGSQEEFDEIMHGST